MGWGDSTADNVQASELEDQCSDSTVPIEDYENLEPPQ